MRPGPRLSNEELWELDPHPGMILRTVKLDADGKPVPGTESLKRVPLDRDLDAAIAWAAKVYS